MSKKFIRETKIFHKYLRYVVDIHDTQIWYPNDRELPYRDIESPQLLKDDINEETSNDKTAGGEHETSDKLSEIDVSKEEISDKHEASSGIASSTTKVDEISGKVVESDEKHFENIAIEDKTSVEKDNSHINQPESPSLEAETLGKNDEFSGIDGQLANEKYEMPSKENLVSANEAEISSNEHATIIREDETSNKVLSEKEFELLNDDASKTGETIGNVDSNYNIPSNLEMKDSNFNDETLKQKIESSGEVVEPHSKGDTVNNESDVEDLLPAAHMKESEYQVDRSINNIQSDSPMTSTVKPVTEEHITPSAVKLVDGTYIPEEFATELPQIKSDTGSLGSSETVTTERNIVGHTPELEVKNSILPKPEQKPEGMFGTLFNSIKDTFSADDSVDDVDPEDADEEKASGFHTYNNPKNDIPTDLTPPPIQVLETKSVEEKVLDQVIEKKVDSESDISVQQPNDDSSFEEDQDRNSSEQFILNHEDDVKILKATDKQHQNSDNSPALPSNENILSDDSEVESRESLCTSNHESSDCLNKNRIEAKANGESSDHVRNEAALETPSTDQFSEQFQTSEASESGVLSPEIDTNSKELTDFNDSLNTETNDSEITESTESVAASIIDSVNSSNMYDQNTSENESLSLEPNETSSIQFEHNEDNLDINEGSDLVSKFITSNSENNNLGIEVSKSDDSEQPTSDMKSKDEDVSDTELPTSKIDEDTSKSDVDAETDNSTSIFANYWETLQLLLGKNLSVALEEGNSSKLIILAAMFSFLLVILVAINGDTFEMAFVILALINYNCSIK